MTKTTTMPPEKKNDPESMMSLFQNILEESNSRIRLEARFDGVDQRFDGVDKRFEAMQSHMDKRFDEMQSHMDKRLEMMQNEMEKRSEAMQNYMDKRLDEMEKRSEMMQDHMDKRFDDQSSYINRLILIVIAVIPVLVTLASYAMRFFGLL